MGKQATYKMGDACKALLVSGLFTSFISCFGGFDLELRHHDYATNAAAFLCPAMGRCCFRKREGRIDRHF